MATTTPVGPDTLIAIKISIEGHTRKFKVPLRDLGPHSLCDKLRSLLDLPSNQLAVFERYSDSAAAFITLDPSYPPAFKSLLRAAKAKQKLRIRTILSPSAGSSGPADTPLVFTDLPITNNSQQTLINQNPPLAFADLPVKPPAWLNHVQSESNSMSKAEVTKGSKSPMETRLREFPASGAAAKRCIARFDRSNYYNEINGLNRQRQLYLGPGPSHAEGKMAIPASWSVFCNACDNPMENEHFHCNICDDGDYDLCQTCVDTGIHCRGTGHWLIRRTIKNGRVVSSQTTTLPPKSEEAKSKPASPCQTEEPKESKDLQHANILPSLTYMPGLPGAFTDDEKMTKKADTNDELPNAPSRTCNNCIEVFPERHFVTCLDCDDFDLCTSCHEDNKHGHHPAHTFKPVSEETDLSAMGGFLCAPGRNVRHSALCDGCDKPIFGVRHKCLNCPDWDYCTECYKNVKYIHAAHRFVPIYEPIAEPRSNYTRHFGIFCDGPLCKGKREHITGIRYKCAICDDTDFCANCEANPENRHNRTHPLIMFKTPVRNVSITTLGENAEGEGIRAMGDRSRRPQPSPQNHAPSEVQTIVDVKPSEAPAHTPNKIEIKDLLAEPIEEKIKVDEVLKPVSVPATPVKPTELAAHYVRDTIADGTIMVPNDLFLQTWTLENPGPHAWPAGCSVRYVGGDNMLNIDDLHPSSAAHIAAATESNVMDRPVNVGESISFQVAMKAPKREGTAISYWRLKTADGFPFGHRLWCHIKVIAPPLTFSGLEAVSRESVPAATKTENFSGVVKAMKARVLAANVGHEAAKAAYDDKKVKVEATRRKLRELTAQLNEVCKEDVSTAGPFAELPVERSAVELDKTVPEVKEIKQRIFTIPVMDNKSSKSVATSRPLPASVEDDTQSTTSSSTMIFPKLDKESPAASMHQESEPKRTQPAEVAAPTVVSAIASPAPTHATLELFDDAESVDVDGLVSSDEDEPFLTDEEYDLLDASDEEDL